MRQFFKIVLASFFVYFFSWAFVYYTGINDLAIQSEDTIPAMFLPVTIIKEGTFYADSYYDMILERYPHPDDKSKTRGLTPFYFKKITEEEDHKVLGTSSGIFNIHFPDRQNIYHYITAFPLVSGLLAVPVYLLPLLLGMPVTWENLILLSHVSSALIMGLSGGFFYLLLREHFFSERSREHKRKSLLVTYTYLFGSINFALISQALWQHGTVQLFTILSLLFLFRHIERKGRLKEKVLNLYFAGFFISAAVISRPTAALTVPFLMLILYCYDYTKPVEYARLLLSFLMGMVPPVLFFLWYTGKFFRTVLNQGYVSQVDSGWMSSLPEGFAGLWLSPSKGILIYSPVFIFSLVGIYLVLKNRNWNNDLKYVLFAAIVFIHIMVLAKWKHWYGGWSFGYRMASDILPFLALLLIPYLKDKLFEKTRKLFYLLLGFSVLVQFAGIVLFDGVWHAAYDKGFKDTGWLWSIKDSEFAFNIRRVLVKLNLLNKSCPTCLPNE